MEDKVKKGQARQGVMPQGPCATLKEIIFA